MFVLILSSDFELSLSSSILSNEISPRIWYEQNELQRIASKTFRPCSIKLFIYHTYSVSLNEKFHSSLYHIPISVLYFAHTLTVSLWRFFQFSVSLQLHIIHTPKIYAVNILFCVLHLHKNQERHLELICSLLGDYIRAHITIWIILLHKHKRTNEMCELCVRVYYILYTSYSNKIKRLTGAAYCVYIMCILLLYIQLYIYAIK